MYFKLCIHFSSIHPLCISEALIEVLSLICTIAIMCITERAAEFLKNLFVLERFRFLFSGALFTIFLFFGQNFIKKTLIFLLMIINLLEAVLLTNSSILNLGKFCFTILIVND